jgi:hypothetical protein
MRKKNKRAPLAALAFVMLLSLVLGGCGAYPEKALDGSAWEKEWTLLGHVAGVETDPGHGLVLSESPVSLAGNDNFYATWAVGDPRSFTNEEGKETDLYDAQVYMLAYENSIKKGEIPEDTMEDWMARERETYQVMEERTLEAGGLTYQVMDYKVLSSSNPYSRGTSAFAVFGPYTITVEAAATEAFTEDTASVLADFLSACHYNAEIRKQ